MVAKGINLKSNINLGDEELFTEIERSVFDTNKDIQIKVIDWLRREIKTVTGIYYKGRQELIWGLGRWEGTRSIRIIENDLNILEYELAKIKYRKLADLRENIRRTAVRPKAGRDSMVCETNRLIRSCRQQRCRRMNRRKMNNNKERRKRYKRKQRKSKELRINEAWKEILRRSEEIVRGEPQEHAPLDKTGVQWDQSKLNLIRKGQKFVPAPRRVDTVAKFDHFENFARKLRLKVFFSNRKNGNDGNEVFVRP